MDPARVKTELRPQIYGEKFIFFESAAGTTYWVTTFGRIGGSTGGSAFSTLGPDAQLSAADITKIRARRGKSATLSSAIYDITMLITSARMRAECLRLTSLLRQTEADIAEIQALRDYLTSKSYSAACEIVESADLELGKLCDDLADRVVRINARRAHCTLDVGAPARSTGACTLDVGAPARSTGACTLDVGAPIFTAVRVIFETRRIMT